MALQDYRPMLERCSNCLSCKWIPYDKIQSQRYGENCPINLYYKWFTYSARGKFQSAQGLLDGLYGYTDAMLEATQACTSCGACDVACKVQRYNLEPLEVTIAIKNDAIEKGFVLDTQKAAVESLKNEQTMIPGMKKSERSAWAKGITFTKNAETVFYPGCKYSYDQKLQPKARAAAELLIKAGVKLGYLGDTDMCCGGRAYQQGFFNESADRADGNINAFKAAGIKTIVTPCSDCYNTLKRQYAARGLDIEILHIVEYLDRLIQNGDIKFTKRVDKVVTYHDPCHLGRLGEPFVPWDGSEVKIMNQVHTWSPRRPRYNGVYGIYDAPRRIIEAIPGVALAEMERIREYSLCCGAGAGTQENFPEFSGWVAGERISEANSTGAEAMVTACPWCENRFNGVCDENGKSIEVIDIIDLVSQAL